MINIGRFNIDVVDTGNFALDGGAMFGVVPKALWSRFYSEGDETNRIPMSSRPLLIQFDDKKILVDAGNGTKMPEKLMKIYGIDIVKSQIELGLAKLNLKPEDITHFIYTHLHFDHAGGSTKYNENGEVIPVFSNAKHYVQKQQYQWALNPTLKDRASFINDDFMPVDAEGLLEKLDGEGELFPGIRVIPIDGHTKSMQMIRIEDGGKSLLFMADLAPTNAHVRVPFVMGYDNFPLTSIQEKQKYFPRAYEEKSLLVFEHDAFIQAGYLNSDEKGFNIKQTVLITE